MTPADLSAQARVLLARGELDLPAPGGGSTRRRWQALERFGAGDLGLAKHLESHTDAVAILREAGRAPTPDALYAVWASASRGTGLRARRSAAGWRLDGVQRFASGVAVLDRALVVASLEDGGLQLFDVALSSGALRVDEQSWPAVGMAGSGSFDVTVDGLEVPTDASVGQPDWYAGRPGFWVGGIGVAAVWHGAAGAVVDGLASKARAAPEPVEVFLLAALGACSARHASAAAALDAAAARIDAAPTSDHRALALAVRQIVERTASEILDVGGSALGPAWICRDAAMARRFADLPVFVRQHHGERDMALLGADLLRGQRLR